MAENQEKGSVYRNSFIRAGGVLLFLNQKSVL